MKVNTNIEDDDDYDLDNLDDEDLEEE